MIQTFKGYMDDSGCVNKHSEADICAVESFLNEAESYINKLNGITTKVDYSEEYEQGYEDACVAIKNTLRTLKNKWKKENK